MSEKLFLNPPRVPLVDPQTGLVRLEWYRWFESMFRRVGGVTAPSNNELYSEVTDAASRDEMLGRIGAVEAQARGASSDATLDALSQRVTSLEAMVRDGMQVIQQIQMLMMLGGDFAQASPVANPVGELDTLHVRGETRLATQSGNVRMGSQPDDGINKLQVDGSVKATLYRVGVDQVVGARQTGVTAVPSYAGQSIDPDYSQAQVQAIDNGLRSVRNALASIDAALRMHGLYTN